MRSMVSFLIKILASFPGLTLLQLLIACSMQILHPWPHDTAKLKTGAGEGLRMGLKRFAGTN